MKVLTLVALFLSPIAAVVAGVAEGWRFGVVVGFVFGGVNAGMALWLFAVISIVDEFRMNGIPYLER